MGARSREVDAYIAGAEEFAQPILRKIRKVFHKACPDLEETIKWSCPHFEYKGIVGGMASFQRHVSFGFWKARLMKDPAKIFKKDAGASMAGVRVEKLSDLPSERVLVGYVKQAVELNEKDIREPRAGKKKASRKLVVPDDLKAAMKKNKKALATFENFSFSNRKEYVEWITEAKREETRQRRVRTAIEWMAEGKPRNWKYMKGRC
ncbi:MAG: YdeI/OmpD-associated family protein [Acidobacteriota bacterium]|nr:YdeI/OmpD-associated family protein [Acidobacteriota bacterium]